MIIQKRRLPKFRIQPGLSLFAEQPQCMNKLTYDLIDEIRVFLQ
jgi:hypothetical protein